MKKLLFTFITITLLLPLSCSKSEKQLAPTSGAMMSRSAVYDEALQSVAIMSEDYVSRETYDQFAAGGDGSSELNDQIEVERKLVKRANVTIRVENLDTADESINSLLNQYNAYSASTSINENSRHYSLRVPAHFYDVFLADMDGMGRLINRFENTEDVTLRYYDLEGRLETKKELLKTYHSYLGKARTIDEILAVEARISELQYDIDWTGTQLRNLTNQVDYATIELSLLGPVTASAKQKEPFGERIKRFVSGIGGFFAGTIIVILGIIIYGIPILAIVFLLYWVLFGKVGLARRLWGRIKK